MKAFYCEFETDFKENSYFNVLAAGEKKQVMRYCYSFMEVCGVTLAGASLALSLIIIEALEL